MHLFRRISSAIKSSPKAQKHNKAINKTEFDVKGLLSIHVFVCGGGRGRLAAPMESFHPPPFSMISESGRGSDGFICITRVN